MQRAEQDQEECAKGVQKVLVRLGLRPEYVERHNHKARQDGQHEHNEDLKVANGLR